MIFTLEAMQANEGDSLLLHYGDTTSPKVILIDGGTPKTYNGSLRPRLLELQQSRVTGGDPLPLEMVMLSHIDNDHIGGLLGLFREMEQSPQKCPASTTVLWQNTFDDMIGNHDPIFLGLGDQDGARLASAAEARDAAEFLAAAEKMEPGLEARLQDTKKVEDFEEIVAVLASVPQGQELRDIAERLELAINTPIGKLISSKTAGGHVIDFGDDLTLTVVAPLPKRIEEYQKAWDVELKKAQKVKPSAYLDKSPWNLASTVVLATFGSGPTAKSMLLTGDARGDDILEGCKAANLLKGGKMHVDVLKGPHHGSDRNVREEFFEKVTADHYVFSGNGKHGNPEMKTLEMIVSARGPIGYTVHLTNAEGEDGEFNLAEQLADFQAENPMVNIVTRDDASPSIRVELIDRLQD